MLPPLDPGSDAAVDAAGVAAFGPLFPTGRPYHLGPVREVRLDGPGATTVVDRSTFFSFDRGVAVPEMDALRYLPTGVDVGNHDCDWMMQPPVFADVLCQAGECLVGPKAIRDQLLQSRAFMLEPNKWPEPARSKCRMAPEYSLHTFDDRVWRTQSDVWDTLAADIEAGRPVRLDPAGPTATLDLPRTDDCVAIYPATFLFRTRFGGAGIVQVLGSDDVNRRVRFRYRMVEPSPVLVVDPPPAPTDPRVFAAVREVTLPTVSPGSASGLIFATGATVAAPAAAGGENWELMWGRGRGGRRDPRALRPANECRRGPAGRSGRTERDRRRVRDDAAGNGRALRRPRPPAGGK